MPGTWQGLANQPAFHTSTMLLLSDGRIMVQEEATRYWWATRRAAFCPAESCHQPPQKCEPRECGCKERKNVCCKEERTRDCCAERVRM